MCGSLPLRPAQAPSGCEALPQGPSPRKPGGHCRSIPRNPESTVAEHTHSSPFGRGQARRIGSRYGSEAGEGVFNPNLEFIRPSSPIAALGYFSRREKNVSLAALGHFSRRERECVAL